MSAPDDWPIELLWRADGHLSDEAVVALADGQMTDVPAAVAIHTNDCGDCANRVFAMASHSVALEEWFAAAACSATVEAAAPVASSVGLNAPADQVEPVQCGRRHPARRRFPWAAAAAAMAIAVLGLVPSLWLSDGGSIRDWYIAVKLIPALADAVLDVVRAGRASFGAGLFSLLPAAAFVLLAIIIAKRAGRRLRNGEAHV